ncbi:heat shock protein transcriptional repressor HspR [Patulibacter sp.]|uniref:heat shock protein transcriptional repressor HspR n=1 Tax=Patulibacter sp. TaxID=1912859 RepID=UPI002728203C|nr:helix-turn-helix transcriptional regulator [Patulibacter sp.]MDO9410932.1 helix-turn-helix transcriptional regulator [Patulibacter sp.]
MGQDSDDRAGRPAKSRGGARPGSAVRVSTSTTIEVDADRGVFMISVAAELAEMHPQTLRMYEQRGLIEPKRSPKGTRLYSHSDVERLRRIQQMTNDLGLNLAGVERVLALEVELEREKRRYAQAAERLVQLQRETVEMRDTLRAEMQTEIDKLRQRNELVPYTGTRTTALVQFRPPPVEMADVHEVGDDED